MIMAFCITIITRCGLNELCFVYVLTTLTGYLVFAPFASGLVRSVLTSSIALMITALSQPRHPRLCGFTQSPNPPASVSNVPDAGAFPWF